MATVLDSPTTSEMIMKVIDKNDDAHCKTTAKCFIAVYGRKFTLTIVKCLQIPKTTKDKVLGYGFM